MAQLDVWWQNFLLLFFFFFIYLDPLTGEPLTAVSAYSKILNIS